VLGCGNSQNGVTMLTKRSVFFVTAVLLGLVVIFSPPPASADPLVTYSYLGPFLGFERSGPYINTVPQLSMIFQFSSPLAYSTVLTPVTPVYWAISDGVSNSFTSVTCATLSCSETFAFSADMNGQITGWSIQASIQNPDLNVSLFSIQSSFVCPGNLCGGDQVDIARRSFVDPLLRAGFAEGIHDGPTTTPLLWTMSNVQPLAVPTTSLGLLGIGLAGLGLVVSKY